MTKNKEEAIRTIIEYLDNCLMIGDETNLKRVNLISYWQKDYIRYIKEENNFNPVNLKTYERGDIIKVNLGFNIGSELGGLHYCVVIDKKNNRNSPVVTIIPLSSQKKDKINKNSIMLGNDIYNKLVEKLSELLNNSKTKLKEGNIIEAYRTMALAEKIKNEVGNIKYKSIAVINQIRVISKQRIYNPKTDEDILAGIKLSNENLNLIDEKIRKIYIKN